MNSKPEKSARILPFRARKAFGRAQSAKDAAADGLRARLAAGTPAVPERPREPLPREWRKQVAWALLLFFALALLLGSRAFGAH